jgi:predicted RNA binding protein YcfA (HicA-like mRNA interferase family)
MSGAALAKKLSRLGYSATRQTGSHMRLTTTVNGEHHVTVPAHNPLRIGTLNSIITDIATHHHLTKDEVLRNIIN